MQLPAPLSEHEAQAKIAGYAAKNKVLAQMIGAGYYDAVTPAVLRRNILENPGFYTSYTPYQAEISGPSGGSAELPEHRDGADRPGDCKLLPAG